MSHDKFESSDNKDLKLVRLAQTAVSRNLTPYATSQLLRGFDKNNLQQFFFYYTLCKEGKITNENYENIVKEFKDKFNSEMIERHKPLPYSSKSSNLYKVITADLEKANPSCGM
ncbi:Uncharacterised protein [Legionella busanensis]|uniref:Uncharacterized protein n=1 Tax=Legionella busanensis TaxID=190655 RepID=A0A378JPA2_9GAMM|nr:hypothetical protein [Legionella busanensis]STX52019.1 Uncharacterised protein [Legionella busanensis]